MKAMIQVTKNKTFNEIFTTSDVFINGLPTAYKTYMQDSDGNLIVPMDILYLLLRSKYGENQIASSSEDMFKNRVYAIIFQYAPTWAKKLDIQDKIRKLTENDIISGAKQINSHAFNPSTVIEDGPNPDSGEIESVNEQTKTKYVKSKLEGYSNLWVLLNRDVTEEFLAKFSKLFKQVIYVPTCDCYESECE